MARKPTLDDCFTQFLADLADQAGHIEGRYAAGAAYVGRRVDKRWRRLEYEVTKWLDERYPQTFGRDQALVAIEGDAAVLDGRDDHDGGLDARTACARARELGAGVVSGTRIDPWREALEQVNVIGQSVADLADGVKADDAHAAAIASHVARRAFSAYRLAKYRLMDDALDSGELPGDNSYQWLEA